MNFGDLKLHVRKAIADRLSNNAVLSQDDFLIAAFNDMVIPRLVGIRPWFFKEFTETTPLYAGHYQMQFPEDLQDLHQLTLITGDRGTTYVLPYFPMRNFFEMYPDPPIEPSNYPAMYTWVNRVAWFNCPIHTDAGLRMVGQRRFQRLVMDSDVPHWMDEDKHMLLVYGVTGYCFALMEDTNMAKLWTDLFDRGVTEWWAATQLQHDRDYRLGRYEPPSAYGAAGPMLAQYWTNPFVIRAP